MSVLVSGYNRGHVPYDSVLGGRWHYIGLHVILLLYNMKTIALNNSKTSLRIVYDRNKSSAAWRKKYWQGHGSECRVNMGLLSPRRRCHHLTTRDKSCHRDKVAPVRSYIFVRSFFVGGDELLEFEIRLTIASLDGLCAW